MNNFFSIKENFFILILYKRGSEFLMKKLMKGEMIRKERC